MDRPASFRDAAFLAAAIVALTAPDKNVMTLAVIAAISLGLPIIFRGGRR